MNKDTIRHELHHILGSTYGLYDHALKYNASFKRLFDQALVHLSLRQNHAAGTAAEVAMHIEGVPETLQIKINAHGSLTPAIVEGDFPIKQSIRVRCVDPIYYSAELSEPDRMLFSRSPVPLVKVIEAALVSREYMELLGPQFHKFASALDAACLTNEDLALSAIVNFDRFTTAMRRLPELRNDMYSRGGR